MKILQKNILLLLLALFAFASCSETDDVAVDDTWAADNVAYTQAIAAEAHANVAGDWKVITPLGVDENKVWPDDGYVYCKVIKAGTSQGSPFYNDVVTMNYEGRLINNYVFDSTFFRELDFDEEINLDMGTPVELALDECVRGLVAALQEMVCGDVWRVYIPSALAYGAETVSDVPSNSMLIFTVQLVDFKHNGETK